MAVAVAVTVAVAVAVVAVGGWRLAVGFAVASLGVACAHLRLRKYAKCRVETLYLSEIVGAEASATSVSGTRVSIMTKATSEAVAGCTGGPRSAIANPARVVPRTAGNSKRNH